MSEQAIGLPPMVADFMGAKAAPRPLVEKIIEQLVEALDADDGDLDLEDSEGGGNMVDVRGRFLGYCPPNHDEDREPDDDGQGDQSWPEWHTRGRHKLPGGHEPSVGHEDDEDDDPDSSVEDDPRGFDPEEDDDRERDVAWPERIRQGLVGGYVSTDSEDDEPWRVAAFAHPDVDSERAPIANDNATTGRPL